MSVVDVARAAVRLGSNVVVRPDGVTVDYEVLVDGVCLGNVSPDDAGRLRVFVQVMERHFVDELSIDGELVHIAGPDAANMTADAIVAAINAVPGLHARASRGTIVIES